MELPDRGRSTPAGPLSHQLGRPALECDRPCRSIPPRPAIGARMSPRYAGVIGAAALMALSIIPGTSSHAQPAWHPIRVIAGETLDSLLEDEDTDGDKKITIDDPHLPGSFRGDKRFWILTSDNQRCEISGTYFLSNLLQEL